MFEGFFEVVAAVLAFFYGFTNSYGLAITLLTLVVMVITAPLTLKSTRSMVQMQRLQPELKQLQAKYKDDRERLNQEMMAFYQENNINPLSGCMPVLLQAPIFIILYQVIRGITWRQGGNASGTGHITGQLITDRDLTPWVRMEQPFNPQHLSENSEMYKVLTRSTEMKFLGMDLSISPSQAIGMGIKVAIPFILLMVGMLLSQIYQNRQIQGRTRNNNTPVNPQQQMIMKVLPFMLPVFSFTFPAGLGYYYLVQGFCRIGLQHYITRTVFGDNEDDAIEVKGKESTKNDKKAVAPSKSKSASPTKGAKTNAPKSNKKPSPKSEAVRKKSEGGTPAKPKGRKSGSPRAGGRPRPTSDDS